MTAPRPRLLLVTPHPIWPPTHGWAVRLWNLLPRLAERYELHALIFTGGTDDPRQREALAPFCAHVFFQQFRDPSLASAELPRPARRLVWDGLRERISALISAHRIDLLQLEGTELAGLLPIHAAPPTIVTAHDLGFETHLLRLRARLGRFGGGSERGLGFLEWLRFARYELAGLARADQIHCMSEANGRLLSRVRPRLASRVRVVANGVDCARMAPPEAAAGARRDTLILGSFPHPPNADAIEYLRSAIWPLVRREIPDARLTLAGASPPDWVFALDGRDGIRVAGEVDDVRPLLWNHAVLAVPLRAGSGTRIKILEAMGAGLPVVSTAIGAAGIAARDGVEIDLAEGPRQFARRLVRRLRNRAEGAEMAARARELVASRYDWGIVAGRALQAMAELAPANAGWRALPRDAAGSGTATSGPALDLLVPWVPGMRVAPGFLDAVTEQSCDLGYRVRFVSPAAPETFVGECARRGIDWMHLEGEPSLPGAMIDRAVADSSATLVAVLDPAHVPRSSSWLGHLVWALRQPNAPAAVQGEVLDPETPATARERLVARDGLPFRFSNLAFSRRTWQDLPFGTSAGAARRWAGLLCEAHQFVLATPDAPADRSLALDPVGGRGGEREGPAASVVICTRDRGAAILPTLSALAAQRAAFAWEVLVVDNGSAPAALAETRRALAAFGARFRLVCESTVGLSAARNCGVRRARGETILFLDDDATPVSGWLESLVGALAEPGVAAAGGPVEPDWEGEPPGWITAALRPYLSAWDRGAAAQDLSYNETPRGANMALRRDAFELVGPFSPHLGRKGKSLRSCEESEWFLRLERVGKRIRYVPAARVRHRTPAVRLTPDWMAARFAEQGLSEAIVDWIHTGPAGIRSGWARHRARVASAAGESGSGKLRRRFDRAAARGYLRGAWIAAWTVPRWSVP